MKKYLLLFTALFVFTQYSIPQNKIDGTYKGAIVIAGMNIDIGVTFKTEGESLEGTFEQQGVTLPLSDIKYNYPSISFILKIQTSDASFDGIVYADSISGAFKQSSYVGRFYLKPFKEVPKDTTAIKESLPYKEEEITFKNGENTFAGTLTLPPNEGKHPAVIMITGSGPQDRNEEILGFKIFGIIADFFTRKGIAVLRYDDRNVGKSKGTDIGNSTTDDFAGDVIEAVNYLKTRNDINPAQIGLFGHSEGGIVAPIAASKNKEIAFIVLMAGTSVKGADIILKQSELIMRSNGESEFNIKNSLEASKKILDAVMNNADMDATKKELEKKYIEDYDSLSQDMKNSITDKQTYAKDRVESTISAYNSTWMKYFLSYDPKNALEKVSCPVLALFGELDLQVPPSQNEQPMRDALSKSDSKDFTIKIFPKANHLFQTATNGSPNEYGKLPKEFVDGFLEYISGWILNRVTIIK